MSAWRAYITALWTAAVLAVSTFISGVAGVLLQSERLGGLAGICGATAFLVGFAACISGIDIKKPAHVGMSREDRARLRDEERRIYVEREIRRMEREAGL